MKLTSITIKNVKSFKEEVKVQFNDQFNILIGPNGGGKSNLLDIITICIRFFFLKGYREESDMRISYYSQININKQLDKFIGENTESLINISFKVTREDIENLKTLKTNKDQIETILEKYTYTPYQYDKSNKKHFFDELAPVNFQIDQELNFEIKDRNLQHPPSGTPEHFYLDYLNYFEFFILLTKQMEGVKLAPIYLYFSPYRGEAQQNFQANLASENFYNSLINYFGYTSKNITSFIRLSSLYFAEKRRKYEFNAETEGYAKNWDNDSEVSLVTKYLEKIGYSWRLELIDINKNIYEIILTKEGRDLYVEQTSSGEKEILNFLLGIFAFNIKDGLIIIDEPEVHLHPKWQKLLIGLFIELSEITGNQFILSTHSPVFINEKTIFNIIRIYRNDNKSQVVSLNQGDLNTTKDLLSIVNSHNNEKMFFADKVILVEGITDRLIFERLLHINSALNHPSEIIEIIEVIGKHNLKKYRDFLNKIKVKNYIIADFDYILQVGDENVKKLFVTDYQKIDKEINDKKSKDGMALSEKLEKAIESEDLTELKELFEYIKNRKIKLKVNLTEDEKTTLQNFIQGKYDEKIYLLREGEIEDYLPDGFKSLEKVIELVKLTNFSDNFDSKKLEELNKLISLILES